MEDLGREQGINFTRKKVIEQYSGFPEGKRLPYAKANETISQGWGRYTV
jgi:hypothetical protein